MSENERTAHNKLLRDTGRFKLDQEQEDTIRKIMSGVELTLEEDGESTLELPQLRTSK